jgi:hypothetical protein
MHLHQRQRNHLRSRLRSRDGLEDLSIDESSELLLKQMAKTNEHEEKAESKAGDQSNVQIDTETKLEADKSLKRQAELEKLAY